MKSVLRFEFYPLDFLDPTEVFEAGDGHGVGPFHPGDMVRLRSNGRLVSGEVKAAKHLIEINGGRVTLCDTTVEIFETPGPL